MSAYSYSRVRCGRTKNFSETFGDRLYSVRIPSPPGDDIASVRCVSFTAGAGSIFTLTVTMDLELAALEINTLLVQQHRYTQGSLSVGVNLETVISAGMVFNELRATKLQPEWCLPPQIGSRREPPQFVHKLWVVSCEETLQVCDLVAFGFVLMVTKVPSLVGFRITLASTPGQLVDSISETTQRKQKS